jgi:hypothetical protein
MLCLFEALEWQVELVDPAASEKIDRIVKALKSRREDASG